VAAEISPLARHVCSDPATAWRLACKLAGPEHLVCITGSLFMAAEMRSVIDEGGAESKGSP
jgi:folylpolyglutamate synthase/dihydropteroate synthase